MARDHTKSTADINVAARGADLTVVPPVLDAEQPSNLVALRKVRGAERDRLYIDQQRKAHGDALTLKHIRAAAAQHLYEPSQARSR